MKVNRAGPVAWRWLVLGIVAMAATRCQSGASRPQRCEKIVLLGEVSAGQEWKAVIGQGWVFRVLPIQPGKAGFSGWDLVVDREGGAGFPDALLVATPPYNSIGEREVGTTFGLRAQDAIGWNPRSFRFLTDPDLLRESQRLYQVLSSNHNMREAPVAGSSEGKAINRQLTINEKSSAGQFRILDARLAPGIADAAYYAENWAIRSVKTPHTFEPGSEGRSTPLGELHWMRFSVTLWFPELWKAPKELHAVRTSCAE